ALAPRVLAPALLERDHLGAAGLLDHLAGDRGTRDRGRADRNVVAAHDKHLAKLDEVAGRALDLVDRDHILLGDPVLLAAGLDDCEHRSFPRVRYRRWVVPAGFLAVLNRVDFARARSTKGAGFPRRARRNIEARPEESTQTADLPWIPGVSR